MTPSILATATWYMTSCPPLGGPRSGKDKRKNAELLTRLGCTVENMIEMQATGTPAV